MRRAARRWPWAGVAWWKTSRTCPVKVGDIDTDVCFICREGLTEAFFLSLKGIHRRDLDTGAKVFATLGQPVLMHGGRPAWDQVHSSGPWDDPFPRVVHDAGELTGAPAASVLVMPHTSHQPPAPEPPQNGQSHQMRLTDTA